MDAASTIGHATMRERRSTIGSVTALPSIGIGFCPAAPQARAVEPSASAPPSSNARRNANEHDPGEATHHAQ